MLETYENNFCFMGLGGGLQIRHCTPLSEEKGGAPAPLHPPLVAGLTKNVFFDLTQSNFNIFRFCKLI